VANQLTVESIPRGKVLHISPHEIACSCGQRILLLCGGLEKTEVVIPLRVRPGEKTEDVLAEALRQAQAAIGLPMVDLDDMT
jgi:hypothetical protein